MGSFDQKAFNAFILKEGIVGFKQEPITLASGRTSHFYVNWRTATDHLWGIESLSNAILDYAIQNGLRNADCFYGVPEGASKVGFLTQYKWAKQFLGRHDTRYPIPMGRGKPKEHGDPKDRYFVGVPEGKIVIIEDVTTTGSSLLKEVQKVREAGAQVIAAIGLTNRMERRDDGLSVGQALVAQGVPYFHMSDAVTLLPLAYEQQKPNAATVEAVEREFEQFGLEKLVLRRIQL